MVHVNYSVDDQRGVCKVMSEHRFEPVFDGREVVFTVRKANGKTRDVSSSNRSTTVMLHGMSTFSKSSISAFI